MYWSFLRFCIYALLRTVFSNRRQNRNDKVTNLLQNLGDLSRLLNKSTARCIHSTKQVIDDDSIDLMTCDPQFVGVIKRERKGSSTVCPDLFPMGWFQFNNARNNRNAFFQGNGKSLHGI